MEGNFSCHRRESLTADGYNAGPLFSLRDPKTGRYLIMRSTGEIRSNWQCTTWSLGPFHRDATCTTLEHVLGRSELVIGEAESRGGFSRLWMVRVPCTCGFVLRLWLASWKVHVPRDHVTHITWCIAVGHVMKEQDQVGAGSCRDVKISATCCFVTDTSN